MKTGVTKPDPTVAYKVTSAFLHQAITWPGVAGAEKTINDTRIKNIEQVYFHHVLFLKCKGQVLGVPEANVACFMVSEGSADYIFDLVKKA